MQPIDPEEQAWDKKKIIITLFILCIIAGLAYTAKIFVLGKNQQSRIKPIVNSPSNVKGASTDAQSDSSSEEKNQAPVFSFSASNIQTTAQEKLNSIKKQVEDLNIQDIASSSPQIQKMINDLKSLENYPKNQAKQMCENICKNF